MIHRANPRFWERYHRLPAEVQRLADRAYEILRTNPGHSSLGFKKEGRFWSARVGAHYRALAVQDAADLIWVWIGSHAEYDHLVRGGRQ
jgi:hypothetical protein